MVTTRLGLAAVAALLGAATGCNQILGTTPPLPFGEGGPTPCGDAEWTHWDPTAAHVYDTTHGESGEDYVTDGLTGLAWQMPVHADTVTWDDASAYCNGLSWGGLHDYRLPTMAELVSLTHYELGPPALDPKVFPNAAGGDFWTSTPALSPDDMDSVYVVSHGDGTVAPSMKAPNVTATAWCVHDLKPAADMACERFSFTDGEQSVRDVETGLVWQRTQSNGMKSWADAQTACGAVPIGGHTWRAPTVSELLSLLDVEAHSPTGLDPKFFDTGEPTGFYWTATVDAAKPTNNAWSVETETGFTSPGLISTEYYVRCVY